MEIDIYARTVKYIGTETKIYPIWSDSDFTYLPTDTALSVLKIIGNSNENVATPNLNKLVEFFEILREQIIKVNSLIFEGHFSESIAAMLSDLLFHDITISHLQLNRTRFAYFKFSPLKTLRELSIKSAETWANPEYLDIDDVEGLVTLLENNIHLNFVQVPERSYDAYHTIIQMRQASANFHLNVVDVNGKATDLMTLTETKLTTKLDSDRTDQILGALSLVRFFSEIEVELTVRPVRARWIITSFLINQKKAEVVKVTAGRIETNEDRINYELSGAVDPFEFVVDRCAEFAGSMWTHLVLDAPVYELENFYRFGRGIKKIQTRLPNLKKVDVRFIYQNDNWAPDAYLNIGLGIIGDRVCNGYKYEKLVQLDIRLITFQCTFEKWCGAF